MLVEVWSDVVCPFCYLGKRRFAGALRKFGNKRNVEVVWKSYLLNPELRGSKHVSLESYLSSVKGWSVDQIRQLHDQIAKKGATESIAYNFDAVKVAGSFDAHRLVQYAAANGRGDAMLERLFRAYFSEGRDIADQSVLAMLAADAGLDSEEALDVLTSGQYATEVGNDLMEARKLGIRGVPCFYFNRRIVVSGAQDEQAFLDALEETWRQMPRGQSDAAEPADGSVCTSEGECEE